MAAGSKSALKITLPSDKEIQMTRTFDAPRERVFNAFIDPDLIPRWWGPHGYTTTVDKMDVRPGGEWRFINRAPDGNDYGFHGVFREIVPPERLVYTFIFEGVPDQTAVETITLEERDGKTEMTDRTLFQTKEARDGMIASGMETGVREGLDRLEELLAEGATAKESRR